MTDEDDSHLLARAVQGDEQAFCMLYRRHRDPVFRFSYRLLGRESLAEDVTHDCFLGLLRRPGAFDPRRAGLRTYLCAAARNLAFKQLRRQGVQVERDADLERPGPDEDGPLQQLLSRELSAQVGEAVSRLPPLQREALVLFEYEGMSLADIAEVSGAEPGAISARLHRARESLRRWLAAVRPGGAAEAEAATTPRRRTS